MAAPICRGCMFIITSKHFSAMCQGSANGLSHFKFQLFNKAFRLNKICTRSISYMYATRRQAIIHGKHHVILRRGLKKLVLGIETSCDDTGAAVVDNHGNVLGEALNSQTSLHVRFGGILPPVAKQLHQQHIEEVVNKALDRANVRIQDVDAIAASVKPGLAMSLLVGLNYAKKLVEESKKPFIPIHHMQAHALTVRMMHNGGHCLLVVAKDVEEFIILGQSRDDAPGDVFDKVARRLKLKNSPQFEGVSGGQAIEIMAKEGNPKAYELVTVRASKADCNFSFSGLKSSYTSLIAREEEEHGISGGEIVPSAADICASFQYAILHHLAKRVQRALLYTNLVQLLPETHKTLVVSGGVASNMFLREGLKKICDADNCDLICPPPKLCTDNGIMIAWNGMEKLMRGVGIAADPMAVDIQPRCAMGEDISSKIANHSIKLPSVKLLNS